MNNQRSFYRFLVAGILALLLISVGGFYWFFAKRSMGLITPLVQPHAAVFVSKQSPVMVSLLVNPDQLQTLEQKGEISRWKTNLFTETSIDYRQDIQPWLGNEVTLAVTSIDIDRDPDNGLQSGYLMALATKDPEKSRGFIEYLFAKKALAGANLVVEQYKGVKIVSVEPNPDKASAQLVGLASAVVDNFALFANDIKIIREAINNLQAPDLDLTSFPPYQKAIEQLPKKAVALAFLNLPAVAQWQGLNLAEFSYDSQITSLVLESQGLLAESTFLARSASTAPTILSQPVKALQYIPAVAGLVISGTSLHNLGKSDLGQLWQQAVVTLYGSQTELSPKLPEFLTESRKVWGINLSDDIFSWVEGEYAIAMLPTTGEETPNWVFVAEKSAQIGDGIANLDAIALNHGVNVSYFFLDQQKVSAWTQVTTINNEDKIPMGMDTKVLGLHTSIDNYEVFASDLQTLDQILTRRENTMIKNPYLQNQLAMIPYPNQGFIYIDWEKSQPILLRQLPMLKYLEVLAKPFFQHLRSLIISSYSQETGLLKGGIFFHLHQ